MAYIYEHISIYEFSYIYLVYRTKSTEYLEPFQEKARPK